ncbi:hypothetical protein RvY_19292 [Ramazzottius varieornatus]|uniref:Uncharacterized protein n=1 Tax=Ramazzottius varieornatus TaxID=947166 RepID=A0A1D1W8X8_RAMVA|nr:hypothetical protein RvY_19292 [Ramazzottius varieornatus]
MRHVIHNGQVSSSRRIWFPKKSWRIVKEKLRSWCAFSVTTTNPARSSGSRIQILLDSKRAIKTCWKWLKEKLEIPTFTSVTASRMPSGTSKRDLISEDGSLVPPAPTVSLPQPEDVAEAETASAEDAASDTSSEIKIPPLSTATKLLFSPLTPTPSIVAPSPRMVTRRALAKETKKEKTAATPDKELTPGPTSSQRKRPNGELTPESGKKRIPPAPSTRPGTQTPSPSRPAPKSQTKASNGTSSIKTPPSHQSSDKANSQLTQPKLPNDGQPTVLGGTQSSNTALSQSTEVTNVKSPAKSSVVAMDVTTDDASKEPTSDAAEGSEQPKVASPSKTEPENENVSELVRHLKYLGESTSPTCENIRAVAEKYRKEEGELDQLLTDGVFVNATNRM